MKDFYAVPCTVMHERPTTKPFSNSYMNKKNSFDLF